MRNLFLISAALFLLSCNDNSSVNKKETTQITPATKDWNVLDNPDFSIRYPKDWVLDESKQMGTTFFLFAPLDTGKDNFRENINLLIQDLGGMKMNMDQYVAISEKQLTQLITDGKLLESKRQNNDPEHHMMVYTGKQGQFDLKFSAHFWIVNSKAYVLTFTGETTHFDAYNEAAQTIMNSFVIK